MCIFSAVTVVVLVVWYQRKMNKFNVEKSAKATVAVDNDLYGFTRYQDSDVTNNTKQPLNHYVYNSQESVQTDDLVYDSECPGVQADNPMYSTEHRNVKTDNPMCDINHHDVKTMHGTEHQDTKADNTVFDSEHQDVQASNPLYGGSNVQTGKSQAYSNVNLTAPRKIQIVDNSEYSYCKH